MELFKLAKTVATKEEFVVFVTALVDDLQHNKDEWKNVHLEQFLSAFSAWVDDMDGFYLNMGRTVPKNMNWAVLADMFMAARIYE